MHQIWQQVHEYMKQPEPEDNSQAPNCVLVSMGCVTRTNHFTYLGFSSPPHKFCWKD